MLRRSNKYTDRLTAQLAGARRQEVNNTVGPRVIQGKNEYLMKHRGVKVIVTDHARHQCRKRDNGMAIETMKRYFVQVVDGLVDFNWKYDDQEIFVYNRFFQRGVVLTGRRDYRGGTDRCLVVVTVYPYGKARPMKDSTEVVYV
ncbi:MAG: hypothetical protein JRE23_12230 [Deltaproteobacteria bacterium]|nr:hypothetical protein [Deltaproteobacteria bacterium]